MCWQCGCKSDGYLLGGLLKVVVLLLGGPSAGGDLDVDGAPEGHQTGAVRIAAQLRPDHRHCKRLKAILGVRIWIIQKPDLGSI